MPGPVAWQGEPLLRTCELLRGSVTLSLFFLDSCTRDSECLARRRRSIFQGPMDMQVEMSLDGLVLIQHMATIAARCLHCPAQRRDRAGCHNEFST